MTHDTSYTEIQEINCNVQRIERVELRFTKKDTFFLGYKEIVVRNIELIPDYIPDFYYRQQKILSLTSSASEVTVKHNEKKMFSIKNYFNYY